MDVSDESERLGEVLEGEVVLPVRDVVLERSGGPPARIMSTPAVQTAAAAAGGFVAGAAIVGLVSRRRAARAPGRLGSRRSERALRGRAPGASELVRIVGTRSLLVDLHLLDGSGGPR